MLSNSKLSTKIISLIFGGLLLLCTVLVVDIKISSQGLFLESKKDIAINLVEIASSVIEGNYAKFQSGELSEEEAKAKSIRDISVLKYGNGNYFWINTFDYRVIYHPSDSINNKYVKDMKGKKGSLIFQNFVSTAKKKGAGFVEYFWKDDVDPNKTVKKVAYVKSFTPWNWMVATGMYIKGSSEREFHLVRNMLVAAVFCLIFLLWLSKRYLTKWFYTPIEKVERVLDNVLDHTKSLADEIVQSGVNLTRSSNDQMEITNNCKREIDHLNSLIVKNSGIASRSQVVTAQVDKHTKNGDVVMQELEKSMGDISQNNELLKNMVDIIDSIGQKTDVINDIVFKTQLLSFNASIEAARAGQHGKGFAVVAEEVGNLASTSGQASEEIQILLGNSRDKVNEIVDAIKRTIDQGQGVTKRAVEIFNEISEDVNTMNDNVKEIVSVTDEQKSSASSVSTSMINLEHKTEENLELSNLNRIQSENVKSVEGEVQSVVDQLYKIVNGTEKRAQSTKKEVPRKREDKTDVTPVKLVKEHEHPFDKAHEDLNFDVTELDEYEPTGLNEDVSQKTESLNVEIDSGAEDESKPETGSGGNMTDQQVISMLKNKKDDYLQSGTLDDELLEVNPDDASFVDYEETKKLD